MYNGLIVEQEGFFNLGMATGLGEGKLKCVKLSKKNWPCVISYSYGGAEKKIQSILKSF